MMLRVLINVIDSNMFSDNYDVGIKKYRFERGSVA